MCVHPWLIRCKDEPFLNGSKELVIPCGRCPECIKKRQSEWLTRFILESQYWRKERVGSVCMLGTLTYDDKHYPDSRDRLVKDWQAFLKSLHRKLGVKPRFYVTTENGSVYGRVHFHFLLFGVPPYDVLEFRNKILKKSWPHGFEHCRVATSKDFAYVSKYVTKDVDAFRSNTWRTFESYSKRPSLGFPALVGQFADSFRLRGDTKFVDSTGFYRSLTRYMSRRLLTDLQRQILLDKYERTMPSPYDSSDINQKARASDCWRKYREVCLEARKKKLGNILKFENLCDNV